MPLLLASLAMLWAAPLLYRWTGRYVRAHRVAERILLVALALFLVLDIIPQSVATAGVWAVLLVAVGFVVPSIVERMWHAMARKIHWVPLVVGTVGLALHAAIDGAALYNPFGGPTDERVFQMAVIFHRFFEGIFIWWALRPKYGWEVSAAVLGFSTSFTLVGYFAGGVYLQQLDSSEFALFQALVAGSLLHLAVDRHEAHGHKHAHGRGEHAHGHVDGNGNGYGHDHGQHVH
jgi:hypothetical protein